MNWLIGILLLFIVHIALILLLEFRNPGKTVAWMFILFLCPPLGPVLYYFMARDYKKRKRLLRRGSVPFRSLRAMLRSRSETADTLERMNNPEFVGQERLFRLLTHQAVNPITGGNRTEVYSSGEPAFSAMLERMELAKEHIHIEFYIFRSDRIGMAFAEVMIRKAREGVKVRMICDGLGSFKLEPSFIDRLKEAGVEVYFFLPPRVAVRNRRVNYRNHRKIVVVDGKFGFVGGLNVGDDYLGLYENMGFWRDTHLQLEGDSVHYLQLTFLEDWLLVSGQDLGDPVLFPAREGPGREQVQILTSGPNRTRNAIQEMCFNSIAVAKRRIWIASPYFIPDPGVYSALKTAALSGVEVIVIMPYHSDSRLVKLASLSYVEELLGDGVRFVQYTKGFIHAKVMIIDGLLASVGTANMDMRSFFYNFEMTALLFDPDTIARLERDFEQDLADSVPILPEAFAVRSRWQKGLELLARLLSPLL
ncbi:cardiolipin synthase [Paenibacillus rubinfantis]|uniref:cardiolipin synthase n=1 Tax=Paenibacillus rubinfantis TaxID=1720296 RepID=UPI00073F6B85|nr:cardiolipin synthase [Paenibacillus rubinfantis]